jgi:hypothetical protein
MEKPAREESELLKLRQKQGALCAFFLLFHYEVIIGLAILGVKPGVAATPEAQHLLQL